MSLTSAQALRLRIQDLPRVADDTYVADGTRTVFDLPHQNITSASAFVLGSNGQWSATAATFNASGYVEFADTISAGSGWRARYVHSVFGDDEINYRLEGGSIRKAAREFVQDLMFDGLKRAKWVAPDGAEYDDTKAIDLLKTLYSTLEDEEMQDAIGAGGFGQWSITQGDL